MLLRKLEELLKGDSPPMSGLAERAMGKDIKYRGAFAEVGFYVEVGGMFSHKGDLGVASVTFELCAHCCGTRSRGNV